VTVFCSIIIPTYNSDRDRLGQLIASLDAQSLEQGRFEVLFVDDGSTSDIASHITELCATRPTYRLIELEHSGWPCRPRNEGTRQATGEWVLYMDHDDVLFPRALEHLERFTRGLDVEIVNPKEVRTASWSWGWDAFTSDIADATTRGTRALLPMTPHKLYRRAFLIENDITFIEERRVLWEDVYFNVLAYSKGARTAVFSSYPIYHWVTTGENSSANYGQDANELWSKMSDLLEFLTTTLSADDLDTMNVHWLRTRIVKLGGPDGADDPSPERFDEDFRLARTVIERYMPERLFDRLGPVDARRARLIAANEPLPLAALEASVASYDAIAIASGFAWHNDAVEFDVETLFSHDDEPLTLEQSDGAIVVRPIGVDILPAMDAAKVELSVRGVTTRETSRLDIETPITIRAGIPSAALHARISVPELVRGRSLVGQRWDIAARTSLPIRVTHRAVRVPSADFVELFALIDGHQVAVVRGKGNQLTVAVDTGASSALRALEPNAAPSIATTRLRKTVITIPLSHVHVAGSTVVPCTVHVTPVRDDGETQRAPRRSVAGTIRSHDARLHDGGAVVTSDPILIGRGLHRVTIEQGSTKRRIGTLTIRKNLLQRVAGRMRRP
jgi:glycosyltransferase involved in cell wall biosynthesis